MKGIFLKTLHDIPGRRWTRRLTRCCICLQKLSTTCTCTNYITCATNIANLLDPSTEIDFDADDVTFWEKLIQEEESKVPIKEEETVDVTPPSQDSQETLQKTEISQKPKPNRFYANKKLHKTLNTRTLLRTAQLKR